MFQNDDVITFRFKCGQNLVQSRFVRQLFAFRMFNKIHIPMGEEFHIVLGRHRGGAQKRRRKDPKMLQEAFLKDRGVDRRHARSPQRYLRK